MLQFFIKKKLHSYSAQICAIYIDLFAFVWKRWAFMSGNFCNLLVKRRDCQVKEVTKFLLFFYYINVFCEFDYRFFHCAVTKGSNDGAGRNEGRLKSRPYRGRRKRIWEFFELRDSPQYLSLIRCCYLRIASVNIVALIYMISFTIFPQSGSKYCLKYNFF